MPAFRVSSMCILYYYSRGNFALSRHVGRPFEILVETKIILDLDPSFSIRINWI